MRFTHMDQFGGPCKAGLGYVVHISMCWGHQNGMQESGGVCCRMQDLSRSWKNKDNLERRGEMRTMLQRRLGLTEEKLAGTGIGWRKISARISTASVQPSPNSIPNLPFCQLFCPKTHTAFQTISRVEGRRMFSLEDTYDIWNELKLI